MDKLWCKTTNIAKKILCYSFYGVLLTAMGLAAINAIGVAFTLGGKNVWYQVFWFDFNTLGMNVVYTVAEMIKRKGEEPKEENSEEK